MKAIVITGAGKAFSGGTDIKEFVPPKAIQIHNLLSLIRFLENALTDKRMIASWLETVKELQASSDGVSPLGKPLSWRS